MAEASTTHRDLLEVFHDGRLERSSLLPQGRLTLTIDIPSIAGRLESGATSVDVHLMGCTLARWTPTEGSGKAIDLLAAPAVEGLEDIIQWVEKSEPTEEGTHCVVSGIWGELELTFERIKLSVGSVTEITAEDLLAASRMFWNRFSQRANAKNRGLGIRLATLDDAPTLRQLYGELLAHLARFNPFVDSSTKLQSDWFEKPDKLFPWLMVRSGGGGPSEETDGAVAEEVLGFALLGVKHLARALNSPADFLLFEFYVAEAARRQGVGGSAMALLFDRYPGTWSIAVLPVNPEAVGFWRAFLEPYRPVVTEARDEEGTTFTRYLFHSALATRPWPDDAASLTT